MTASEAIQKIKQAKDEWTKKLADFASKYKTLPKEQVPQEVGYLVQSHSEVLDSVNAAISEVHEREDFFRKKNLRSDFLATIENFTTVSLRFWTFIRKISESNRLTYSGPGPQSYRTIQQFLGTFETGEQREKWKKSFLDQEIDTTAFDEKLDKPMSEQENTKRRTIAIIVGAISVLLALSVFIFQENLPTNLQALLRILFALGCGGLSAAIIGSIDLRMEHPLPIWAAGGFAIFLLIFFFNPVGFNQNDFGFSIYLRDKASGQILDASNFQLAVKLDRNLKTGEYKPTSKNFEFQPIPIHYMDKTVELELSQANQWLFDNGKRIDTIRLKEGEINVNLMRDTNSLLFMGNVTNTDGHPLPIVSIFFPELPQLNQKTDSLGNFHIVLPSSYDRPSVRARFELNGYKPEEQLWKLGVTQTFSMQKMRKR